MEKYQIDANTPSAHPPPLLIETPSQLQASACTPPLSPQPTLTGKKPRRGAAKRARQKEPSQYISQSASQPITLDTSQASVSSARQMLLIIKEIISVFIQLLNLRRLFPYTRFSKVSKKISAYIIDLCLLMLIMAIFAVVLNFVLPYFTLAFIRVYECYNILSWIFVS